MPAIKFTKYSYLQLNIQGESYENEIFFIIASCFDCQF